ncbi:izumo sperm-egg fusion protein 1 [Anguilla anguilla]|uniref:izumo sperm-egg fusion protein 1 n=1 Tax=Anguilla anguilla TaxID=7936 RepID=UPI0015AA66CB|nr:izumo sperm-egg fusion protein 1 [Anguilla anguilla]
MILRTLVCLLCLVLALPLTSACLQCDRQVRHLHEDYLLASSYANVEDQIELKKIIDHTYFLYQETSNRFHGVIDPTTLYRARTEYQSEFHKFLKRPNADDILFETILIMDKGRQILQKHLEVFSQTGLCPNKCGLLHQRVMDCSTCRYEMRTCPSPAGQRDCGEYHLGAEEGDQVVLNCFLPWHILVMGHKDYKYSREPGLTSCQSSDTGVLVVTPDSRIVLNQLRHDEQGVYRCLLLDNDGTVLSCMHYVLTVTPLPLTTPRHIPTLPTLPPGEDHTPPPQGSQSSALVGIVAAVTALGLTASLAVVVVFGVTLKRRGEEARGRRRGQEVEMTRVSTSSD